MKRFAWIVATVCIAVVPSYGQKSNRIAWFVDSVFVVNPEGINPSSVDSFSINPDSSIQVRGIDYNSVANLTYRPECELLSLDAIAQRYCRKDEMTDPIYIVNDEIVTRNIDSYYIDADIIDLVSCEDLKNFIPTIKFTAPFQTYQIIRILTDQYARKNLTFIRTVPSASKTDEPAIIVNGEQVNRASLSGISPDGVRIKKDTTIKINKTIYNEVIEITLPDSLYTADRIRQHFLPDVPAENNIYMIDDQLVKADPDLPLKIDKDYILAVDCVRCQDFESWGDLLSEFYIIRIYTKSRQNIPKLIGSTPQIKHIIKAL